MQMPTSFLGKKNCMFFSGKLQGDSSRLWSHDPYVDGTGKWQGSLDSGGKLHSDHHLFHFCSSLSSAMLSNSMVIVQTFA